MDKQIRCNACFQGVVVNGVCNSCGRPVQTSQDRENKSALPLYYLLDNRYRLFDVLGGGGFGITYAAWDYQRNCRVAVKELFPKSLVIRSTDGLHVQVIDEENRDLFQTQCQRFCSEAELLSKLRTIPGIGQGITSVYDLCADNGTVYYIMEYLDGHDLNVHAQLNGRASWKEMGYVAQTLIHLLGILHERGVIHRDISPDNIFLTRQGKIRLIDFGTARSFLAGTPLTAMVKRGFAPLEQQFADGKQGPWTDVYALCVTMYYLMSGVLPPDAVDRPAMPVEPLHKLCPQVPEYVCDAIEKGMSVDISQRFRTMAELGSALFPAQPAPKPPLYDEDQFSCSIVCTAGLNRGKRWELRAGRYLRIGRQPACDIHYELNTPGVSGFHCTIYADKRGQVWLRDEKSTYGTYLGQTRLPPEVWQKLSYGSSFGFVQEQYVLERKAQDDDTVLFLH